MLFMNPAAVTLRQVLALAVFVWLSVMLSYARLEAGEIPANIVVGTMRAPPFVLRSDDGQWSGLSIDLWRQIAAELKVRFELREYDYDLAGLLEPSSAAKFMQRLRQSRSLSMAKSTSTSPTRIFPPASASRCTPSRRSAHLRYCLACSVISSVQRLQGCSACFSSWAC
jgi:ABC-type amino acid transport substrate-binding protein